MRLKEIYLILQFIIPWISIPYGAIKRKINLAKEGLNGEFQFLMVRLKENKRKYKQS